MRPRLGQNVRAAWTASGLTLERLAWSAGLSKSYLSEIEAGRKAPTLPVLRLIGTTLGVEGWVLLGPPAESPTGRVVARLAAAADLAQERADTILAALEVTPDD